MIGVVEIDPPGEPGASERPVLGVAPAAGVGDHVAAAVRRPRRRGGDGRGRRLVRRHGERRLVARRGSRPVRHEDAEAGAVVGGLHRGERVARRRRAGDVDAVPLPLERERRIAARGGGEGRRTADADRLARRVRGDRRREAAGVRDPVDVADRPAAREVVEAAVAADVEVDRCRCAAGEADDRVPVGGIELADPAAAVVGEEVVADVLGRELPRGRVVERAAGDRAACGRRVAVAVVRDRVPEARVAARPLGRRPAVVRAGDAVVDLLPRALADVVDEHPAGAGLERERERITQAVGPDRAVLTGGRGVERVVRRDRAVRVDAEDLPEQVGERPRRSERARSRRRRCRASRPCRSGARRRCGSARCGERVQVEEDSLAARPGRRRRTP